MDIRSHLASYGSRIASGVPLAQYTTFGIGGSADYFFETSSNDELVSLIQKAKAIDLPATLLAGGSNLVVSDEGVRGLVVRISHGAVRTARELELEADAGVLLGALIDESIGYGYAGLESLVGIPGTVGGAVVGNAGAYGQSIGQAIIGVEVYDGEDIRWISKEECDFSYRMSIFKRKPWVVLSVRFGFTKTDTDTLMERARGVLASRARNYRPEMRCPGSFFKNLLASDLTADQLSRIDHSKIIEGKVPAGYLLEVVGAKGLIEGGVAVSGHHGNLILNTGKATSADVALLSRELKRRVFERFGIALEEEVRYIG